MYRPTSVETQSAMSNGKQVDEFHARMKHFFRNIRPKDFKDADPTAEFDWNQVIDDAERQRNSKKQ